MDPVSHVLLGASLGYSVFGKTLGRTAALAGGLAAFVPDADVFIRSANDPLLAVEFHRHFTHALAFAPVGAALVSLLWIARKRWRPQALPVWLCCLLAYVSHCLLDAATSYGTQLFWPFSNHRVGWDFISIIDPLFTVPLLVALALALRFQRRAITAAGVAFVAAYMAVGAIQHARAVSVQKQIAQLRGHTIERFEVMPTLGNNLVWRALYQHGGRMFSDRIRVGWFSGPTVVVGWSLPRVTEAELTDAERARNQGRSFARFMWFSEGWVARKPTDATVLGDMRYSVTTEAFDPIWGIRFTTEGAPARVEWVNRSRDRRVSFGSLWHEISGRDARYKQVSEASSGESMSVAMGISEE